VRQGTEVRQEVITLAVRDEDVENFLEQIHRSGATVESLDIEPCALFRTVERFIRRREDEQEVYVLVDVGARSSQVIIGKGREISFVKSIDIGGRQFQEIVSRKLGITLEETQGLRRRLVENRATEAQPAPGASERIPAPRDPVRQAVCDATRSIMEELGREIALCLRYYSVTFRGQRPARVRLLGGEASDQQLQAILNASLTIPVEPGRPLYSVNTARMKESNRRGTMCEWALALGLGLKMTTGNFGARDGKPRDPNAPREIAPTAEVVDLDKAVAAVATAAMPSHASTATTAAAAGEVVHA
jgi:type IV pilus assembly protein PilM